MFEKLERWEGTNKRPRRNDTEKPKENDILRPSEELVEGEGMVRCVMLFK